MVRIFSKKGEESFHRNFYSYFSSKISNAFFVIFRNFQQKTFFLEPNTSLFSSENIFSLCSALKNPSSFLKTPFS